MCWVICQKSGQAHPDAGEMLRAFFVAGAKRKTIELSGRSLCTTARSTEPEVGYKPRSPLKLEYICQENGTSAVCAFFVQVRKNQNCGNVFWSRTLLQRRREVSEPGPPARGGSILWHTPKQTVHYPDTARSIPATTFARGQPDFHGTPQGQE